jgi:hypothetical protein
MRTPDLAIQSVGVAGFEPTASSSRSNKSVALTSAFPRLSCSDIPQDPQKSVAVRGDCHAVRHAPAHTMIMTVYGNRRCERHTQPGPLGGLCRRHGWQCPSRPHR